MENHNEVNWISLYDLLFQQSNNESNLCVHALYALYTVVQILYMAMVGTNGKVGVVNDSSFL